LALLNLGLVVGLEEQLNVEPVGPREVGLSIGTEF
jgi:hypothetical protein